MVAIKIKERLTTCNDLNLNKVDNTLKYFLGWSKSYYPNKFELYWCEGEKAINDSNMLKISNKN